MERLSHARVEELEDQAEDTSDRPRTIEEIKAAIRARNEAWEERFSWRPRHRSAVPVPQAPEPIQSKAEPLRDRGPTPTPDPDPGPGTVTPPQPQPTEPDVAAPATVFAPPPGAEPSLGQLQTAAKLDFKLVARSPAAEALVEAVHARVLASEWRTGNRKRRPTGEQVLAQQAAVAVVAGSLLRSWGRPAPRLVDCPMMKKKFSRGRVAYWPFRRAVKAMEAIGLLSRGGHRAPGPAQRLLQPRQRQGPVHPPLAHR